MFDDNQVWKLHSDFSLRLVPNTEFKALLKQHTPTYFDNKAQVFRLRDILSEAEKQKYRFWRNKREHRSSLGWVYIKMMTLSAGATAGRN